MIRMNIPAASAPASQFIGRGVAEGASEEDMFGRIDQRMKRHGGNRARCPLEYFAVGESRDGCQDHVSPVGKRLWAIVDVGAAENYRRDYQHSRRRAELLHEP